VVIEVARVDEVVVVEVEAIAAAGKGRIFLTRGRIFSHLRRTQEWEWEISGPQEPQSGPQTSERRSSEELGFFFRTAVLNRSEARDRLQTSNGGTSNCKPQTARLRDCETANCKLQTAKLRNCGAPNELLFIKTSCELLSKKLEIGTWEHPAPPK